MNTRKAAALIGLIFFTVSLARAQQACPYEAAVCAARDAVFRIEAYDPAASAVRIGRAQLVTNRHVVADEEVVTLIRPDGSKVAGRVVPSAYPGDLVLIEADMGEGPILVPDQDGDGGPYQTIGYDLSRRAVEVYEPGPALVIPTADRPLARLQHLAPSGAGNSGGALVDREGELVGITTSGGEGRSEAIPAAALLALQAQSGPQYGEQSRSMGAAYRACDDALAQARRERATLPVDLAARLEETCLASANPVLIQLAAQAFGQRRELDRSARLFEAALATDPDAINASLGYATTLHLSGRYDEVAGVLRRLLRVLPQDATVQRLALQAGKWGGARDLAEQALALIKLHNPEQADAARRFFEADMPPPGRAPRLQ